MTTTATKPNNTVELKDEMPNFLPGKEGEKRMIFLPTDEKVLLHELEETKFSSEEVEKFKEKLKEIPWVESEKKQMTENAS